MPFENPSRTEIEALLRRARRIAVVGLSENPARPSHRVASALQGFGYTVLPVNPALESVLGTKSVPDLDAAVATLEPGEHIDIVDVFRHPRHVAPIVDDVIRLRLPALWLQDGVIDEESALRARAAGVFVVMNRCLFRDRATF